jgi:hypothetical protein
LSLGTVFGYPLVAATPPWVCYLPSITSLAAIENNAMQGFHDLGMFFGNQTVRATALALTDTMAYVLTDQPYFAPLPPASQAPTSVWGAGMPSPLGNPVPGVLAARGDDLYFLWDDNISVSVYVWNANSAAYQVHDTAIHADALALGASTIYLGSVPGILGPGQLATLDLASDTTTPIEYHDVTLIAVGGSSVFTTDGTHLYRADP